MVQITDSAPVFMDNTIGTEQSGTIWIKEGGNPIFRQNRISGIQPLQDLGPMTISDGAKARVESNTFTNCQGLALVSSGGADPIVRHNSFRGNSGTVILVSDGCGTFAENEISDNSDKLPSE